MSAIDDLPPLREVIRRHALSARKSLGQNFLLDLNLTARIARAAGPLEQATIIEIGPGPGGLTRALLALGARRVIAIERDERAVAALEEISARYPGRLEIICADAQHFDPRPLLGAGKLLHQLEQLLHPDPAGLLDHLVHRFLAHFSGKPIRVGLCHQEVAQVIDQIGHQAGEIPALFGLLVNDRERPGRVRSDDMIAQRGDGLMGGEAENRLDVGFIDLLSAERHELVQH